MWWGAAPHHEDADAVIYLTVAVAISVGLLLLASMRVPNPGHPSIYPALVKYFLNEQAGQALWHGFDLYCSQRRHATAAFQSGK